MRDLNKLTDEPVEVREDYGIRIPVETLFDIYPAYHDKSLLPRNGGVLDQDHDEMEAIYLMSSLVAWYYQELKDEKTDFSRATSISDL